jgi:uncharacterized protein (DUF1330 family)
MSAYLIVQGSIEDEAQFQIFRQAVVPFIASFGAKQLARYGRVEILEGEHDRRPLIMYEFPSMDAIHAFWDSPDYIQIKELRDGAAALNVWAFPGV